MTAKIGIPSITDLKLDKDVSNYYLLNGVSNKKSLMYRNSLIESKPFLSRGIKPSIVIKNQIIKSGTGTVKDPYILEG